MRKLILGGCLLATACLTPAVPPGFSDTGFVTTGLSQPVAITFAHDNRLFIAEKTGAIKVAVSGTVVSTFATLNVSSNSERGLLGIALDPDFQSFPYVYVYYTTSATSLNPPATPKNRVSRLTANVNNVVPGSEIILLDNIPSDAGNHNAGCLRFAPDGTLYISTGDGGATAMNSQTLSNLAGKILRINKDGSIPNTNPFFGSLSIQNEIFCYGLRNPFRFNFRPGTSTLYIGDVGQSSWEEVNVGVAGGNFGWPTHEGPSAQAGFMSPAFSYATGPTRGSITGGCFVTLQRFAPPYNGSYFYGDYIRKVIRRVVFNGANQYVSDHDFGDANGPVDFAEGADGNLYYVALNHGTVRRISYKTSLTNLTLNPTTVVGGAKSKATVTLDLPAPAAGALIVLSSTAGATVPPSVRIPSGGTSIQFDVNTTPGASGTATITASRLGITKQAILTFSGTNNAQFVGQSVPTTMNAGQQYAVSVTMKNTGTATWSHAAGYRLFSFNPSGNTRWGFDRVFLPGGASVPTNSNFTFNFTVTAPATPGVYNFQWKMLLNGTGTFGQPSTNVAVTVN